MTFTFLGVLYPPKNPKVYPLVPLGTLLDNGSTFAPPTGVLLGPQSCKIGSPTEPFLLICDLGFLKPTQFQSLNLPSTNKVPFHSYIAGGPRHEPNKNLLWRSDRLVGSRGK